MRLQHKVFTFLLPSGDKTISRLLTSKVKVNNIESDILMSDLFHSIKKESGNTITGFSILELLNDNNEIKINDKIYTLSFVNESEEFNLSKVTDPKNFVRNDIETSEDEDKEIETRIIDSVPVMGAESQQPDAEATASSEAAGTQSIFENEDYNSEKEDQGKEGYVEYNTNPKSNMRLLVQEKSLPETPEDEYEKIVVVEIGEDDFEIGIRDEYDLKLDAETKTFSYSLVENIVEK